MVSLTNLVVIVVVLVAFDVLSVFKNFITLSLFNATKTNPAIMNKEINKKNLLCRFGRPIITGCWGCAAAPPDGRCP